MSDTIEPNKVITSDMDENNQQTTNMQPQPLYLTQQVNAFYQFLYLCMMEWRQLCSVSMDDVEGRNKLAVPEYVKKVDTTRYRAFLDYWSYRLYQEFGIKRRILRYGPSDTTITEDNSSQANDNEEPEVKEETSQDSDKLEVKDSDESDLATFYGKSSSILVQFFYDKALRGYDKCHPITQLCRHMVFDMESMRIVSLGVTKAFDFDWVANGITSGNTKPDAPCAFRLEEFLEGTMVVYNPTLETYGQQSLSKYVDADEAEEQAREDNMTRVSNNKDTIPSTDTATTTTTTTDTATTTTDTATTTTDTATTTTDTATTTTDTATTTTDTASGDGGDGGDGGDDTSGTQIKKRHLGVSTRKKLGTSYFNNPGKTFGDMFGENNKLAKVDLELWPEEFLKSHCFVFNVEHSENRIVNPEPNNCNTLVAIYKLCDPSITNNLPSAKSLVTAFMKEDPLKYTTDPDVQSRLNVLWNGLCTYGAACIYQIPVQFMEKYVSNMLGDINMPIISKQVAFCDESMLKTKTKAWEIINEQSKYQPGIMIYDTLRGIRTKIRNPKYSQLLDLKGNVSITVSEMNRRNLFKLYWRLRQSNDGRIGKFLKEFDTADNVYKNIFDWFKLSIHTMTENLYLEYLGVFVKHTKPAREIPYEFKPLCGELHKTYMENRHPTTRFVVMNFVNNMPYFQVYWRLFGLKDGVMTEHQLQNATELAKTKEVHKTITYPQNTYVTKLVNNNFTVDHKPVEKMAFTPVNVDNISRMTTYRGRGSGRGRGRGSGRGRGTS